MSRTDADTRLLDSLALKQCRRERSGQAYRQYRGQSGVAWLFPAAPDLYCASLRLYEPYSFGGQLRQLAMRFGLGSKSLYLDKRTLEPLERLFAQTLGRETVRLAFFVNHPGPLGKAVVLVLDAQGEVLAIAKLAQQPAGQTALENEKKILETLACFDDLKRLVPAPLGWLEHGGKKMLLMSLGPRRASPTAFGQVHRDVLARFQRPFLEHLPFRESTMWLAMNEVWERYGSELSQPWRKRYGWAFGVLARVVGDEAVPVSLAHRDFAPWNMRLGQHGLFVFDWETASRGYMVNYDYFHFHFMTSVLLRGRVSAGDVRRWLFSAPIEAPNQPGWAFLSYLTDLGLSYHQARFMSQTEDDNKVLHQVAWLLDAMHSGELVN